MMNRQFLWGLSGGIAVMAVAGAFWFGLAMSNVLTPNSELLPDLMGGGFSSRLMATAAFGAHGASPRRVALGDFG